MDFKELLKKYWFVFLVGIVLIGFIGVYAIQSQQNKQVLVSSKQNEEGKYVVYSIDGEDVYADDFYNSLYTENGLRACFVAFQRAILDKAYTTTQEQKDLASNKYCSP